MISFIPRGIAYTFLVVAIVGVVYLYAMEQESTNLFKLQGYSTLDGESSDEEEYNAATHEFEVNTYLNKLDDQSSVVESPILSPKSPRPWVSARHPKKAEESLSGSPESVDSQLLSPAVSPRPARVKLGTLVSPLLHRNNQAQSGAKFATLKSIKKYKAYGERGRC